MNRWLQGACSTRQRAAMAWHNSGLPFSPMLPLFRRLMPNREGRGDRAEGVREGITVMLSHMPGRRGDTTSRSVSVDYTLLILLKSWNAISFLFTAGLPLPRISYLILCT